jgi:predicted SAM-dependent methyltransferase
VYLSHVLEHFDSPGKAMREGGDTVLGALRRIHRMLRPGGTVRIAVPDFRALAEVYLTDGYPLHPRILGRLMGEQDYAQNRHATAFDRPFLEHCLRRTGFEPAGEWDPVVEAFERDGSFDSIDGRRTSLNLLAVKPHPWHREMSAGEPNLRATARPAEA